MSHRVYGGLSVWRSCGAEKVPKSVLLSKRVTNGSNTSLQRWIPTEQIKAVMVQPRAITAVHLQRQRNRLFDEHPGVG